MPLYKVTPRAGIPYYYRADSVAIVVENCTFEIKGIYEVKTLPKEATLKSFVRSRAAERVAEYRRSQFECEQARVILLNNPQMPLAERARLQEVVKNFRARQRK